MLHTLCNFAKLKLHYLPNHINYKITKKFFKLNSSFFLNLSGFFKATYNNSIQYTNHDYKVFKSFFMVYNINIDSPILQIYFS